MIESALRAAQPLRLRLLPALLPAIALLLLLPAPAAADEPDLEAARAEARGIVKLFAGRLQGALQGAIAEQGFIHAIEVCRVEAPQIAAGLSEDGGWTVDRTALRLRNPANAPDAWERGVLETFVARGAAGEDLMTVEEIAVIAENGGRRLRYMKAIPTGELCTACHGSAIDPELAAAIRAAYPEDRATGFAPGELRGAFTLSRPLD